MQWILPNPPEDSATRIDKKEYVNAGKWGGAFAGFILSLPIIIDKSILSFGDIQEPKFLKLLPIYVFFCITCGLIAGWIICRLVLIKKDTKNKQFKNFYLFTTLFLCGFILMVSLHQFAARDALVSPNKALKFINKNENTEYIFTNHSEYEGKVYRMGGGPMGEPDFEGLASGFATGVTFIYLVLVLSKYIVPDKKQMFSIAIKSGIISMLTWCIIYLLYLFLKGQVFNYLPVENVSVYLGTEANKVEVNKINLSPILLINRSIFVADFPHPERIYLFGFFPLIYIVIIVMSIRFNAFKPSILYKSSNF